MQKESQVDKIRICVKSKSLPLKKMRNNFLSRLELEKPLQDLLLLWDIDLLASMLTIKKSARWLESLLLKEDNRKKSWSEEEFITKCKKISKTMFMSPKKLLWNKLEQQREWKLWNCLRAWKEKDMFPHLKEESCFLRKIWELYDLNENFIHNQTKIPTFSILRSLF